MKLIFNNQNKIQPKIAVLVPAFNEETNIEYSYECLNNEINDLINNKIISDQSIIFYIDDGSKDKTLDKIKEVKKKNESKILAISLKKNYGHQYAILAGLKYLLNQVDAFISIDCDMQHDYKKFNEFINQYVQGYDIVNSKRINRNVDFPIKKYLSNFFYFLYNLISGENISGYSDYRLISKKAAKELLDKIEHPPFIRGTVNRLNLANIDILTSVTNRRYGKSKYSFKKMLFLALSSFFSNKKIIFNLFLFNIIILELVYLFYILITFFYNENLVDGWPSIIISISFAIILITILLIQNIKNNEINPYKKKNLIEVNIKEVL